MRLCLVNSVFLALEAGDDAAREFMQKMNPCQVVELFTKPTESTSEPPTPASSANSRQAEPPRPWFVPELGEF